MQKVKPCQTVKELYQRPARVFLLQAIPAFFETHCISAVELMHNYEWVRTLEDSGMMLQTMIQRAVLLGASYGGDLRDNRARLENLIREATAKLRQDTQDNLFPAISQPAELAKLADKLCEAPQGGYILQGTLARHLRAARNANTRIYQLITILEASGKTRPGHAFLHGIIDEMISELIAIPRVIPGLIGDVPDYGTRLHTCARLFLCQPVHGQYGKDQGLDLMARSFATRKLPRSHTVLGQQLTYGVNTTAPLHDGRHSNELKYFRQLCKILRPCIGPHLPAKHIMAAINARSARLADPDKIRDSLSIHMQPDEKIQKLFFIADCICDTKSRGLLADMIFRYALAGSFRLRFQTNQIPLTRRLHRLVELNRFALRSGFDPGQKQRMAQIFDDVAFALAENARVFDIIAAQKTTSAHKLLMLYKLFAAGDITEGKFSQKARHTARHYLHQRDFLTSYRAASKITGNAQSLQADLEQKLQHMGLSAGELEKTSVSH